MKKIKEAKLILSNLGLPKAQQNDMSALTFLALCSVGKRGKWQNATAKSLTVSKGIMQYILTEYGIAYAPNTRETVRRNVLHQFNQAGIVEYNPDKPDLAVNSPKAHYRVSESVISIVKKFGTADWESAVNEYRKNNALLSDMYQKKREFNRVPVKIANQSFTLSPGKHSKVLALVVNEFCPRFSPGAKVLYLGDTENKSLFVDTDLLNELKIGFDRHSKLPDVILYKQDARWLFLIEVATTHGPLNAKRFTELEHMLSGTSLGRVYVTAFADRVGFRKFSSDIAWETEVWIASEPDHMIHFNGDRFIGPR